MWLIQKTYRKWIFMQIGIYFLSIASSTVIDHSLPGRPVKNSRPKISLNFGTKN